MRKQIYSALAAAGMVASLALPGTVQAANGILFDQDGGGGGGAAFVDEFSWGSGNLLFDDVLEPGVATTGTWYGQTILSGMTFENAPVPLSGARVFTYQFEIPISVSLSGATLTVSQAAGPATFKIFVDEAIGAGDGAPDPLTGLGFGDIGTALTTGQAAVLEGSVDIRNGSFTVTNLDALSGEDPELLGATNGTDVATIELFGSTLLEVTVDSQDLDYFTNPFPALSVGVTVEGLASLAPFGDNVAVSDSVAGITPFFGDAESVNVDTDGDGTGDGLQTLPVNDFECHSANPLIDDTSPCDMQAQSSGTSKFTTNVAEPATLAVASLGLLGIAGLRRRRAAA